jgi:hypothetical protein
MPGWQESKLRKGVPPGKSRVVGVDIFSFEEYLVRDCDTRAEAFELADKKNQSRKGQLEDVYYVFDDRGEYIRGVNLETGILETDDP